MRQRGFALLVTLLLLTFIVVLAVGLATYTRIETGITGNVQRQTQARQHALLALDLALSQLQEHAGPDQRVTATAGVAGAIDGARHFTGVWDATDESGNPRTWLVSGNEAAPLSATPDRPREPGVELVGRNTSGEPREVVAPLIELHAPDVPGVTGAATIGRYAWWVGDQGVKAPVAVESRADAVVYPPYDSSERRTRLRQQMTRGGDTSAFEPQSPPNAAMLATTLAPAQLAFFRTREGAAFGTAGVREHFHVWNTDNSAVLASTTTGGLRQDLSLRPELLGSAFVARADVTQHVESSTSLFAPQPTPALGSTPLRLRHRMTGCVHDGGLEHRVGPVLSYFLLSFRIRTQNGSAANRPLEVCARWMVSLWNPYTASLVPEDLRLEIDGLPSTVRVVNDSTGAAIVTTAFPHSAGESMRISLPWDATAGDQPDRRSWLPGRVYTWTSLENTRGAETEAGFPSRFYSRSLSADAGTHGVIRPLATPLIDGDHVGHAEVSAPTNLVIRLFAIRASGDVHLATFRSPEFEPFVTASARFSSPGYQTVFLFRLLESRDTPANPSAWLQAAGVNPLAFEFGPRGFIGGPNGPLPHQYGNNYTTIADPDRLLDRALPATPTSTTGQSYNEDTPLFELPRAAHLSLGELQHVAVAGGRPFAIGNPWGNAGGWNALFDQYYFSGLSRAHPPPDLARDEPAPNHLLQRVRRSSDGGGVTWADIMASDTRASSAAYVLQRGAFNVNSTHAAAWESVLRGIRQIEGEGFEYLDATLASGTAADTARRSMRDGAAWYYRFPQTAQETFKADSPASTSTYAASTTAPPSAASTASNANTHLFRRGARALSSAQTAALAQAVANNVRMKHASSGPFRSIEEFLAGSALYGGKSALEAAIASAGLNAAIEEFSSQWLTQADLMTALAPVLFARSDTFIIRAYGEGVNSATHATEARAWCEARVQRMPDYLDPADPAWTESTALSSALNRRHGRRFKIVSFRWLTRSDI